VPPTCGEAAHGHRFAAGAWRTMRVASIRPGQPKGPGGRVIALGPRQIAGPIVVEGATHAPPGQSRLKVHNRRLFDPPTQVA